jgi:hypothetical protein
MAWAGERTAPAGGTGRHGMIPSRPPSTGCGIDVDWGRIRRPSQAVRDVARTRRPLSEDEDD